MLTQNQINFLKKHIDAIVWHWSAGTYSTVSPKYHFNITYDGKLAHAKQTKSLYEVGEHCWKRNTGKIGITLCGMYDNPKTAKLDYPIEEHQIEVCAKLTAELCVLLDIDPYGQHLDNEKRNTGTTLVNTGNKISCPNIADHAWYAKQDKYYPTRWDVGNLEPLLRKKTIWYYGKLKSGQHKMEFLNNVK